jgi:hypothetical protein
MHVRVGKAVILMFTSQLHRFLLGCCVWLALGALSTSYAHQTGNSYLNIRQVDGALAVDLDFYVRDLGNLLQKPGKESEPPPTADQLKSLQEPITAAIQKSLKLEIDEQLMPLEFTAQSVTVHNDGLYVRQQFRGPAIESSAKFVVIRYEFFTQNDRLGRAFLRLALNGDEISSVIDQSNAIQRFALGETKRISTIFLFAKEGAKHIWNGADHLLFLLTLLLPGVMLWKKRSDLAMSDEAPSEIRVNRQAEMFAFKVITAFTIAHSITLGLATFSLVSFPEKLIESLIAFSIMVSAVLNLQKKYQLNHWQLAFGFGLIHGLGFANGLKDLGLSSSYFLETLIAFNVGVEFGQLSTVIVVALPVIMFVRSEATKRRIMVWGSLAVLAISTLWLVQRLLT